MPLLYLWPMPTIPVTNVNKILGWIDRGLIVWQSVYKTSLHTLHIHSVSKETHHKFIGFPCDQGSIYTLLQKTHNFPRCVSFENECIGSLRVYFYFNTLTTDQLFNLEFQFESCFKLEFQPKFGMQLGFPIPMGIDLGEWIPAIMVPHVNINT